MNLWTLKQQMEAEARVLGGVAEADETAATERVGIGQVATERVAAERMATERAAMERVAM